MKTWSLRILLLAALTAAGIWAWGILFPRPEQVIRKRLTELARAACIAPNESPLARLANAQKVTTFFAEDVQITVDIPGHSLQTFSGIDELRQAAVAARSAVNALKVELLDINVTLAPGKQAASVDLTAKGVVPGEKDFYVQELKLALKKIEGAWLITRVEPEKTLR